VSGSALKYNDKPLLRSKGGGTLSVYSVSKVPGLSKNRKEVVLNIGYIVNEKEIRNEFSVGYVRMN
jgi:hypothetical protein